MQLSGENAFCREQGMKRRRGGEEWRLLVVDLRDVEGLGMKKVGRDGNSSANLPRQNCVRSAMGSVSTRCDLLKNFSPRS